MEANVHHARVLSIPQAGTSGERPLFNLEHRFAVLWSPKSACTTTLIWFISTLGRLDEARQYGDWPHRWRTDVYDCETQWRESLRAFDRTWKTLRVIRDPYARAVSSYRHALQHGLEGPRIAAFLGRSLRGGYSFSEFLEFLAARDLSQLNPHLRPQRNAFEAWIVPERVINVSRKDLFAGLNEFEAEVGLPETAFGELTWIQEVENQRKMDPIDFDGDLSSVRFSSIFAKNGGSWPAARTFLTEAARRRIERIYAVDFAAYGRYL